MEMPFSAVMPVTHRPPVVFTRGEGSWLADRQGPCYLDFVQGWTVNGPGHSPRVRADALTHQAKRLPNVTQAQSDEMLERLADAITDVQQGDREDV